MAAEKKKFIIPSVEEMEDGYTPTFKPQDTMKAYKRQLEEESENNPQRKKTKTHEFQSHEKALIGNSPVKENNSSVSISAKTVSAKISSKVDVPLEAASDHSNNKISAETGTTNTKMKEASAGTIQEEKPGPAFPPVTKPAGKSNSQSLLVNPRQRGNPILKFVRNIPWEFAEVIPDYVMGVGTCALFLSLRYHQLNPNYIHDRLKQLGRGYELRVMLVQVDIKEPHHLVKDLSKICILADCTLILAFSPEEAGRYLETFKVYEFKPPEAIMEKTDQNFLSKLSECLTTVKSVNKTDASTLLSAFDTLEGIMDASKDNLSLCPGFGPQKAKRLYDVFHTPFVRGSVKVDKTNLTNKGTHS